MLMCVISLLLILILPNWAINPRKTVDYNRAVDWQRRTLYCARSWDGTSSGDCYLTLGKTEENQPIPAKCRNEKLFIPSKGILETRTLCNIECNKADRDSVISKTPNSNRQCIRYHTYNTQQNADGDWFIWRSGDCQLVEISLEVHCGFP